MLTAIQLNNEFSAGSAHVAPFRGKIHNVIANRMLRAKMDSRHAMCPQPRMEFEFCRCHIAAQLFCTLEDFGRGAFMHSTPSAFGASPN